MPTDFSVPLLGGFNLPEAFGQAMEGGEQVYRQRQFREELPEIMKSGDPAKVSDFISRYPEASKEVAAIAGYRDDSMKQEQIDLAKKIIIDKTNPVDILEDRVKKLRERGQDDTKAVNALGEALADPTLAIQRAERTWQTLAPEDYLNYQKGLVEGQPVPTKLTTSQQDYLLAKEEGFPGTFIDFKQAVSGQGPKNDLEMLKLRAQIVDIEQRIQERETKRQQASEAMDTKTRQLTSSIDSAITEVDKAAELAGAPTSTGILGWLTGEIPTTPAYKLRGVLNTVKANIGFDKLQAMRDASPTGGALGQVSERELNFLQSTIAALDPAMGDEELARSLAKVKLHYENWKRTLNKDYGSVVVARHPELGDITEADIEATMQGSKLDRSAAVQKLEKKFPDLTFFIR